MVALKNLHLFIIIFVADKLRFLPAQSQAYLLGQSARHHGRCTLVILLLLFFRTFLLYVDAGSFRRLARLNP